MTDLIFFRLLARLVQLSPALVRKAMRDVGLHVPETVPTDPQGPAPTQREPTP